MSSSFCRTDFKNLFICIANNSASQFRLVVTGSGLWAGWPDDKVGLFRWGLRVVLFSSHGQTANLFNFKWPLDFQSDYGKSIYHTKHSKTNVTYFARLSATLGLSFSNPSVKV